MSARRMEAPGRARPELEPHSPHRLKRFVALALLLHVEALLAVGTLVYLFAPRDADVKARLDAQKAAEPMDVSLLDQDAAREIVADLERQEEARKKEQARKEEEAVKAPGQVVEVPKPREEQRPESARFAAEHDVTVPKETKRYGKFDENARQGDRQGTAENTRPATPDDPAERPAPLRLRMPGTSASFTPQTVSRSATPARPTPASASTTPAEQPAAPDGFAPLPRTARGPAAAEASPAPGGPVNLLPSPGELARAVGSGTTDYLPNVDDGDDTALNAKKWRFASFFNRVKRQVQDQWHPAENYRRHDPTGAIYGHTNRLTVVRVDLKPDGFLAAVLVQQPSGLEFLDDEALEAFKSAQPFPNPPKALVEGDGLVHFTFGFLFEVSDTPRMRLFKYNM